jgi:predicted HTH transcriptional regulator
LPENWTVKNLLEKHASQPYNPDIANALFRSGYIESWGRGTLKIIRECKQAGIPEPVFSYDSSVSVRLSAYFLLKKVFLALRQKDETSLYRKSEAKVCPGL